MYYKKNVALGEGEKPSTVLCGRLMILENDTKNPATNKVVVAWVPNGYPAIPIHSIMELSELAYQRTEDRRIFFFFFFPFLLLEQITTNKCTPVSEVYSEQIISVDIRKIFSIKKNMPDIGISNMSITLRTADVLPSFFFLEGGMKEFLSAFNVFLPFSK